MNVSGEQMPSASEEAPRQAKLPWIKPALAESSVEEITALQPFNGVPTPHDGNSLQYS